MDSEAGPHHEHRDKVGQLHHLPDEAGQSVIDSGEGRQEVPQVGPVV